MDDYIKFIHQVTDVVKQSSPIEKYLLSVQLLTYMGMSLPTASIVFLGVAKLQMDSIRKTPEDPPEDPPKDSSKDPTKDPSETPQTNNYNILRGFYLGKVQ